MISVQHFWGHFKKANPDHQEDVRTCLTDKKQLYEISGTTTALAEIEVLVYFTFLLTMVLYIARSRCSKSGIDNSEQFEEQYMSYLANMIIQSMVFIGKKYNRKFTAKHFIDKERSVEVESIFLKIKLTAEDFH
jgi:hypothetical protein